MQFAMPKGLIKPFLLLLLVPGVTACVGAPPIVTAQSACSALLPDDWREGVEGAPLPQGDTVGDWIAFADAQTGQLDKSNDRYRAAIGIVERCEKRDAEAIRRTGRKFLGLF